MRVFHKIIFFLPRCRKHLPHTSQRNGFSPLQRHRKMKEKGLKMYQQFNVINEHQANGYPCKLTSYNVYLWILSWLCNVDNSLKLRPHSAHSYLKAQAINYSLKDPLNAYFIHHYGFSSV